jgi:NADH pyrophosphatase NudC (nudix superfamily)
VTPATQPAPGGPAAPAAAEPGGVTPEPGELGYLALSRGEVDRSGHLRADDAWLAAAWADPATRVVVVEKGRALVTSDSDGTRLLFVRPDQAPDGVRFLLGVAPAGTVFFGVDGPLPESPDGAAEQVRAAPLREAGPLLSDRDAGLMTHAVALANFHDTHHFCPNCGEPSEPVSSGHARRCTVEGTDEFPRVDPAMIVLVTDPDDRALLARNAAWPARRVSILAGFVEAGESAEQAVAREVGEEVGIAVGRIRYLGSQPWPMPQSLMLGFRAEAAGRLDLHADADEIAEANWYSRAELAAAIGDGTLALPPPVSIAHQIIRSWYGSDLPGTW